MYIKVIGVKNDKIPKKMSLGTIQILRDQDFDLLRPHPPSL